MTGASQDQAYTQQLVALVGQAPGLKERAHAQALRSLGPGSRAAVDSAQPLGQHVLFLAGLALSNAIEHLEIWRLVLVEAKTQPMAAHMTLLRGALEGAVTCRWLVDPAADSRERIRRGVTLLREDWGHRQDFERQVGHHANPPGKSARERLRDLASACKAAGIKPGSVMGITTRCARYADSDSGLADSWRSR